jgi:hypothetical protein
MKDLEYINPLFDYILSNNLLNKNDKIEYLCSNPVISWKLICKYKRYFTNKRLLSQNQNINIDIIKDNIKRWDILSLLEKSIYITFDDIINNKNIFYDNISNILKLIFNKYIKCEKDFNNIKDTWIYEYIYETYIKPNIYYNYTNCPDYPNTAESASIFFVDYKNNKINIYDYLIKHYKYIFNNQAIEYTKYNKPIHEPLLYIDYIILVISEIELDKIIIILDDLLSDNNKYFKYYYDITKNVYYKDITKKILKNPNITFNQAIMLSEKYNSMDWDLSYYSLNPNLTLKIILENQNVKWNYLLMTHNNFYHNEYYQSYSNKKKLVNEFMDKCGEELIKKACHPNRLFNWNEGIIDEYREEYLIECKKYF